MMEMALVRISTDRFSSAADEVPESGRRNKSVEASVDLLHVLTANDGVNLAGWETRKEGGESDDGLVNKDGGGNRETEDDAAELCCLRERLLLVLSKGTDGSRMVSVPSIINLELIY